MTAPIITFLTLPRALSLSTNARQPGQWRMVVKADIYKPARKGAFPCFDIRALRRTLVPELYSCGVTPASVATASVSYTHLDVYKRQAFRST